MKKLLCILLMVLLSVTGCQSQKVDKLQDNAPPVDQDQSNTEDPAQESEANTPEDTTSTETTVPSKNEGTIEEIAKKFFETLVQGEFKKLLTEFAYVPIMASQLTEETLEAISQQIIGTAGKFEEVTSTYETEEQEYTIVNMISKYTNLTLNIRVVFNDDKTIAGFNFLPYNEKKLPSNVTEESMTFGSEEYTLTGALTFPKDGSDCPVVILVHGSGPNDMDETIGPNSPFKDIAYALGEQGIGVLRYNKRTLEHTKKVIEEAETLTVYEETIDDVVYAYNYLKKEKNIEEDIYILGHSLGGYLMPRIAKEVPEAAGYIMLAGNASPLEDLYEYQILYLANLDGTVTDQEQASIDYYISVVEKVRKLDESSNYSIQELGGLSKSYWLDLQDYDPVALVRTITSPLLILQGSRDYQITVDEFNLYREGLSGMDNVSFKLYEGLNHLFLKGEGTPGPEEYAIPSTVDSAVIEDITTFIKNAK